IPAVKNRSKRRFVAQSSDQMSIASQGAFSRYNDDQERTDYLARMDKDVSQTRALRFEPPPLPPAAVVTAYECKPTSRRRIFFRAFAYARFRLPMYKTVARARASTTRVKRMDLFPYEKN
ncbi:hypothetical protein ALC57_15381, partial [Trachymyrmex cornetzi]